MFETLLAILGACLSVAQIAVDGRTRGKTFRILFGLLAAALFAYFGWRQVQHTRYINAIADEITTIMSAARYQSAEQLARHLSENRKEPVSAADLDEAIERQREKGYLCSSDVTATAADGRSYLVRVYGDRNFGC